MKKDIIFRKVTALFVALVIMVAALPVSAFAVGAGDMVVVGVCPDFGINMRGSSLTGIAYEHLEQMKKHSGHRYTYVEGTPQQLMLMLAENKIDIIPCVTESEVNAFKQYLAEQGKESTMELCGNPILKKFSAIYINGNSDIDFMDVAALSTAKIGYLADNREKYFVDNKFVCTEFDTAEFIMYQTESQMKSDLQSGKLDAVAKECLRPWSNESIVYQFITENCYFLVGDPSSGLGEQIAMSLNNVTTTDPYFSADMYVKYLNCYGVQDYALTRAEKDYVAKKGTIRIAYNTDSDMLGKEQGTNNGVEASTASLLKQLQEYTGLNVTLVSCSGLPECLKMLENDSVDAVYGGVNAQSVAPYGSYFVSAPVNRVPVVIAGYNNASLSDYVKIAVPAYADDITGYVKDLYPSSTLMPYADEAACIKALADGEADLVCAGAYELLYLDSVHDNEIEVVEYMNAYHTECIAMKENPGVLALVIGKALARMSNYEAQVSTFDSLIDFQNDTMTFARFVQTYLPYMVAAAVLLLVILVAVLIMLHLKSLRLSKTDPLTGGRTKETFLADSKALLKKTSPDKWAVAVFDFNKFKYVNERLGYEEGSRMLGRMFKTLSDHAEDGEVYAHLSDDKFAIVMHNATDKELTARLQTVFDEFTRRNALFVKYPTFFSAGICRLSECVEQNGSVDLIAGMDRAIIAKKSVKGGHGTAIAFYDEKIREKILREKDYENAMPTALKEHEFECYLQPKYGLKSRHIEGAEALIRWNSKEFGFVYPNDFIPLSEKNGFVVELDFYILEEVCKAMRRWIDNGKTPVVVSVNQSRLHLNNDDYIWRLREIVDKYDIPYEYIELELTESVFTEDVDHLLKIMHKLHEIGFKLSIDDFGSGYSSLNMLKDIPADVVKIDREFFNGTVNSEKGRAVIETVVDLANKLHMEVISEGVETSDQVEFLSEINCHMVQGYFFSKPMTMGSYETLWFSDLEDMAKETPAEEPDAEQ